MAKKTKARPGVSVPDDARARRPARQVPRPSAAVPIGSDAPVATIPTRPPAATGTGAVARPTTTTRINRPSRAGSLPSITDYGYVFTDLRRIGVLAVAAFAVLIGLTFVVH